MRWQWSWVFPWSSQTTSVCDRSIARLQRPEITRRYSGGNRRRVRSHDVPHPWQPDKEYGSQIRRCF